MLVETGIDRANKRVSQVDLQENPNEGEHELSTPTNDKKGKKAKKHK